MSERSRRRQAFGGVLSVVLAASCLQAQQPTVRVSGPTPVTTTTSPALPATTDAPTFQTYDLPKEMAGVIAARLQILYGSDPVVRVATENNSGRLMVYGGAKVQHEIAGRIQTLQQEIIKGNPAGASTPAIQARTYSLRNVAPRELEDAIQRLAGPRMTITTSGNGNISQVRLAGENGVQDVLQIDHQQNLVTLQGTPTMTNAWMQVVNAIDRGKASPDRPTQILPLAPADPARVEKTLRLVKAAFRPGQELNPQDDDELAAQMIPGQDPNVTVMDSMASLSSESGLFGDVQIDFVAELGLVMIKGSKKDVQRVIEVIEKIKQQAEATQPQVKLVLLKHVDSQALATVVKELYDQILAERQGRVSITSLGQPNALLLIGQDAAVKSVIELLEKLDQPLDPSSQLRVFRLIHASAVDAQTTIRSFFVENPGDNTTVRTGLGTRVKIIADFRTNSLIVQASPRDLSEVARFIQEIDVEGTAAENQLRVFGLKHTNAADLQTVLQAAINGESTGGTGQGGQGGGGGGNASSGSAAVVSGRLTLQSTEQGKLIQSGILTGVVITANPNINSLVVRAPTKSMPLIEALIKQLDQPPSAEAQIKVFEIKNGDATQLTTELQQLFGLPTTAGGAQGGGVFGGAQNQALNQVTGGGENSLVTLRLAVDTRTNSIIASGSSSDLQVIQVLLLRLDENTVKNRKTEVIWLRNSNAQDLANAIQSFLTNQRNILNNTSLLNQTPPLEQLDREVLVAAEPTTNSLIVSATPRYAAQIREMIEKLDRRPPLVMVQILLAEVTLEDNFEWGTEWGLQDALLFDRNSASGGTLGSPAFNTNTTLNRTVTTGLPQNVAGQSMSNFGLGRSNANLGYGGLVLSASSESVSALLRCLQDANRLQILSRPQVMTIDNVEAFVQVGAQVPRVTGVNNNVNGNSINTADTPVGLLMRLQPRTNQDGLILMNVAVERSSVGDVNAGIPVGFGPNGEVIRSPIINKTLAQTRVTAYDGQTVVFAGLITKTRSSRSRRIPYLADIPILGALFKYDTEAETRTELMVVMTPHIVRTTEDMQLINDVETSRMSWCLADILNVHGDASLQPGNGLWGPAASPVIYPDFQPTVDSGVPGQSLLIEDPNANPGMQFQLPQGYEPSSLGTPPGAVEMAAPIQQMRYAPQGSNTVTPASSNQPITIRNNGNARR